MAFRLENLVTVSFEDIQDLLQELDDLEAGLERRFNRPLFRRVRQRTGSQAYWAEASHVTQATIGNWERGYTVPGRPYRRALIEACKRIRSDIVDAFGSPQGALATRIDVAETSAALRKTIIRAALTDFRFDEVKGAIVPVPFAQDFDPDSVAEIQADRNELIDAVIKSADLIVSVSSEEGSNTENRILKYFETYRDEASSSSPNPRLMNRLGSTISRVATDDDFRSASNIVDVEAVDGFVKDHIELMRLYFREALARAQEIESAELSETFVPSAPDEFTEVAAIMDRVVDGDGSSFIDKSIPTLLRDIAGEIRGLNDAVLLTNDPTRVEIYSRRRSEAFKNGRIYIGRFVFYSALLISVGIPTAPQTMDALAQIMGLSESTGSSSIRKQYEKMQESFPALPSIPELDGGQA